MPVELGYVTIAVPSVPRAMAFFGTLLGWRFETSSGPDGAHVENTRLPIGLAPGEPADFAALYFKVADIGETLAAVVVLGGVAGEVSNSPSGLSAVCADDQGVRFSLWQPAPGFDS